MNNIDTEWATRTTVWLVVCKDGLAFGRLHSALKPANTLTFHLGAQKGTRNWYHSCVWLSTNTQSLPRAILGQSFQ